MKEYPISFLVRLQPKHKNIIKKFQKKIRYSNGKHPSEAWVIRLAIEGLIGDTK